MRIEKHNRRDRPLGIGPLRDWREPRDLRRIWRDPPGWWPCQSSCCSSSSTSGCSCAMCLGSSSSLPSGSSGGGGCTPAFTIDLTQIGNGTYDCCAGANKLAGRMTACLRLFSSAPGCCVWTDSFCDLCTTNGNLGGDTAYANWRFSIFMCTTPQTCQFGIPPINYGVLPSQSGGPWVFLEIMNDSGGCTNTMLYRIAASSFNCNGTNVFSKAPGNWGAIDLCAWPDTLTATALSFCAQSCVPCTGPFALGDLCLTCNGCSWHVGRGTEWAVWYDAANDTWYLSHNGAAGGGFTGVYACPGSSFDCFGTSIFHCIFGGCNPGSGIATLVYSASCAPSSSGPGPCCDLLGGGPLQCEVDLSNLASCLCFGDPEIFFLTWNFNAFRGSKVPTCGGGAIEILITLSCDPNAGQTPGLGQWTINLHIVGGGISCDGSETIQFSTSVCDPLNMQFNLVLPCTGGGCPTNQAVPILVTF